MLMAASSWNSLGTVGALLGDAAGRGTGAGLAPADIRQTIDYIVIRDCLQASLPCVSCDELPHLRGHLWHEGPEEYTSLGFHILIAD